MLLFVIIADEDVVEEVNYIGGFLHHLNADLFELNTWCMNIFVTLYFWITNNHQIVVSSFIVSFVSS